MPPLLKSPSPINTSLPSVFLAGSIEMGTANDWQAELCEHLADLPIAVFNPRRDDWDASWQQNRDDAQFREQVEWELAALERADLVAFYFEPGTRSPISLLELGLFHRKAVACCPEGFWRKGNVDLVCERYNVPMVATLEDLAGAVRGRCLVY